MVNNDEKIDSRLLDELPGEVRLISNRTLC